MPVAVESWGRRGFVPDNAGLGLLCMDCEWRADTLWAASLDAVTDRGNHAALAVGPTARQPRPPAEGPDSLRPAGATRLRYSKLMRLVVEVEAHVDGDLPAFSVLAAVEQFAERGGRSWLKVAGEDKGYVLEACVRRRRLRRGEFALEFGCFVGYTTTRLGELHRRVGQLDEGPCVVSLEREAVHASIARHLLDLARLRRLAEVHTGLLPLVSPRASEEFGGRGAGFAFMDHKGTRFHEDLADLAALALPAPGGGVLADNTLNPGSPGLLWCLSRGGLPFTAAVWSLGEFAHTPPVEDWQCLSDATARPPRPSAAWDPETSATAGARTWVGSSKAPFAREPWREAGAGRPH